MPFDGNGTYSRVHRWTDDRDNGIRILADRHDEEDDSIANALNQAFLRNGIVPMTGGLVMNGNPVTQIRAGTPLQPGITFELDPDSGFFQPATGQLGVSINGIQRGLWTDSGLDVAGNLTVNGLEISGGSGNLTLGDGTAAAPALTFGSVDLDTGLYHPGEGQIGFSLNGTERMLLSDTGSISAHIHRPNGPGYVLGLSGNNLGVRFNVDGAADGTVSIEGVDNTMLAGWKSVRLFGSAASLGTPAGSLAVGADGNTTASGEIRSPVFRVSGITPSVYLASVGGNGMINWDANDYFQYLAPGDQLEFYIGSARKFAVNTNGFYVDDGVTLTSGFIQSRGGIDAVGKIAAGINVPNTGQIAMAAGAPGSTGELWFLDANGVRRGAIGNQNGVNSYHIEYRNDTAGGHQFYGNALVLTAPLLLFQGVSGQNTQFVMDNPGHAEVKFMNQTDNNFVFYYNGAPIWQYAGVNFTVNRTISCTNDIGAINHWVNPQNGGTAWGFYNLDNIMRVHHIGSGDLWLFEGNIFRPPTDVTHAVGSGGNRMNAVFSLSFQSTCDAREKDWIGALNEAELAASRDFANEIGMFRWNNNYEDTQLHTGVRAQELIAILERHGLDWNDYGFIRHDVWEESTSYGPSAMDEDGTFIPGELIVQPAGDRFSVQLAELALFIAASQEQRIAKLEAMIVP